MGKKEIFISYDYDNDKHYKNLLVAWDKNSEFDFNFYDASVTVAVDSTDAGVIKRVISSRISSANHFLCIIGEKTSESNWIKWEIDKAIELNKKIIGVKIDSDNKSPLEILGIGATWAMSFTFDSIIKAIENA